ncbi:hypothetical protein LTR86_007508 [Recurvomyces mirabilis]|nr:hypothetical protein LTR86_007508 [Recurvomyces mirabilis]
MSSARADPFQAACYEKSVLKPAVAASGIWGARLLTSAAATPASTTTITATSTPTATPDSGLGLACPSANGTTYTASSGDAFVVECGIDHPGGNLVAVTMTGSPDSWLEACIETCTNTTACIDVSLSGRACYLKKSLSSSVSVANIDGARLVQNLTSTTSSSTTTTSPPATASPVAAAAAVVGTFDYFACFTDSVANRTLQGAFLYGSSSSRHMTLEICASFCSKYAYFGVEYAEECYCGNAILPPGTERDPTACSMACAGNSTENCGGPSALSLYENNNYSAPVTSNTAPVVTTASAGLTISMNSSSVALVTGTSPSGGLSTGTANSTTVTPGSFRRKKHGTRPLGSR